jgi:hypothetical protein
MRYKTLLLAPDLSGESFNPKYGREEIESILQSGLQVTPKIGEIRSVDLVRLMSASEYDIVWLVTHGSREGFLLSDGIFPYSRFAALVRDRCKLVVLNSCEGLHTAQTIQNETATAVIAAIKSIGDDEAYQFGTLLAQNLASLQTISGAYHASIPANNDGYVYLGGDSGQVIGMDWVSLYAEVAKVAESVHGLRTEIALLKQSQANTAELIKANQDATNAKLVHFERLLDEFQHLVRALQNEDNRISLEMHTIARPSGPGMPAWQFWSLMAASGILIACIIILIVLAIQLGSAL